MHDLSTLIKELLPQIRVLIASARQAASRTIDTLQVQTNFEIGRLIVEHEQGGEERAEYGKALLKELSTALTAEFGRGSPRAISSTCAVSIYCSETVLGFPRPRLGN